MSSSYLNSALTPATQREPLANQVPNSAGGFVWEVDDWTRLDRFLILGSEGGSYYASERALTRANAACVERCIAADGIRLVNRLVEISESGRAPKNDPAILALAMAAKMGSPPTRVAAYEALPKVCRIGTHLFHFVNFAQQMGGWGRGMRRAVAAWFNGKSISDVAYQMIKYQQRDGWATGDLLRLSHAKPPSPAHSLLYSWATGGEPDKEDLAETDGLEIVWAHDQLKHATTGAEVCALIRAHNLPRESVPTEHLTQPMVWEALLERMPITALVRNLATMTRIGLIAPMSAAVDKVRAELADADKIKKARVHPIAILAALKTYQQGHGERGNSTWTPVTAVVDALDAAFYLAFANVQPTGKRHLLALDVSGSMSTGSVSGVPGLTPREASAALAMVTCAVEPKTVVMGFSTRFVPLDISARRRLDDVVRAISNLPFERTDCSLPMTWAAEQHRRTGAGIDAFCVYTDNETYAGRVHPAVALRDYRRQTGIAAKSVVVGMVANPFTIADPSDAGMLDVVGFDAACPAVIADFVRG